MAKLDFNVPVLSQDGTPAMRAKMDRTKIKPDAHGRMAAEPVLDDNGFAVQEPAMLRELLSSIVDNTYNGEEAMEFQDRLMRGKLARKLSDGSGGSHKNYSPDEIAVITDCMMKSQMSPSIIAQVQGIIESGSESVN